MMESQAEILPKTEDEYLQYRVVDQINWFEKKSKTNKNYFLSLKISEITLALFIPFASAYIKSDTSPIKIIVGFLGVIVAGIAGIITLVKFQENWIEYRSAAESLKLEKHLFLSKAGPYKDLQNPYPFFVERVESIIATSTQKWVSYIKEKQDEKNTEKE